MVVALPFPFFPPYFLVLGAVRGPMTHRTAQEMRWEMVARMVQESGPFPPFFSICLAVGDGVNPVGDVYGGRVKIRSPGLTKKRASFPSSFFSLNLARRWNTTALRTEITATCRATGIKENKEVGAGPPSSLLLSLLSLYPSSSLFPGKRFDLAGRHGPA